MFSNYDRVYDFVDPLTIELDLGWMSRTLTKPKENDSITVAFHVFSRACNLTDISRTSEEAVRVQPRPYSKHYIFPESITMDVPALRITIDGGTTTPATQCKSNHPASVATSSQRLHLEDNLINIVKQCLLDDIHLQNAFMHIEVKDVYSSGTDMLRVKIYAYFFLLRMKRDCPTMSRSKLENNVKECLKKRAPKSSISQACDRTRRQELLSLPKDLLDEATILEMNLSERMKELNFTSPIFPKYTFQRADDVFDAVGQKWLYESNWYHCIFIFGGVYKNGTRVRWNEKFRTAHSPEYRDIDSDITIMVTEALCDKDIIRRAWKSCEMMDLFPDEQGHLKCQMRVGLKDDELLLVNIDMAAAEYARVIRNWLFKRGVEVHCEH